MIDKIWIGLLKERVLSEQHQTDDFRSCVFFFEKKNYTIKAWRILGDWIWGVYQVKDTEVVLASNRTIKKIIDYVTAKERI